MTRDAQLLIECIADADTAKNVVAWLNKTRNEAGSIGGDAVLIWAAAGVEGKSLGPVLINPCHIRSIDMRDGCTVIEIDTDGVDPLRLSIADDVTGSPGWSVRSMRRGALSRGFVLPSNTVKPPGQRVTLDELSSACTEQGAIIRYDEARDIVSKRRAVRVSATKAVPSIWSPLSDFVADSPKAATVKRYDIQRADEDAIDETRIARPLLRGRVVNRAGQFEYIVAESNKDFIELARERLAALLDPATLQLVVGLEHLADDNGAFTIDAPTLARLFSVDPQGIDNKDRRGGLSLRQTWGLKIQELARIRFEFDVPNNITMRFPLFVEVGDAVGTDTRATLARRWLFNPQLWAAYNKAGHVAAVDAFICQLHAQRDGWAIKIACWLSRWLSRSHTTRGLDKVGRSVDIRMSKLLDGARIDYQKQLKKQGRGWLRRRVLDELNKLRRIPGGPMFYFEHKADDDDDLLRFAWGDHLREVQTRASSKRIEGRERRIAKRKATP